MEITFQSAREKSIYDESGAIFDVTERDLYTTRYISLVTLRKVSHVINIRPYERLITFE